MVRPESLAVGTLEPSDRRNSQDATVVSRNFYGHDQLLELRLPSGRLVRARRLGFPAWHPGDRVKVWIDGPADVLARDCSARGIRAAPWQPSASTSNTTARASRAGPPSRAGEPCRASWRRPWLPSCARG